MDVDARTVWLPPRGMTGHFTWFDARAGVATGWCSPTTIPATSGKSHDNADVVEVRFTAVAEPHEVVEEADFVSDDPAFAGTMTMTWSLEAVDAGTLVTITATDVPDGISSADHAEAFASTLDNLETWLASR